MCLIPGKKSNYSKKLVVDIGDMTDIFGEYPEGFVIYDGFKPVCKMKNDNCGNTIFFFSISFVIHSNANKLYYILAYIYCYFRIKSVI